MKQTFPGIDLDPLPWPEEEWMRWQGGRYVRLVPRLVMDERTLDEMVAALEHEPRLYYDTETSGLNPHQGARICGHALGRQSKKDEFESWYIPIRHLNPFADQLPSDRTAIALRHIFRLKSGTITGHNLKFDRHMARADEIEMLRERHDTAVMANLHNENEERFGLKALSGKYLAPTAASEEEEMVKWMKADARRLKMNYRKPPKKDPLRLTYLQRFGYSRTPIKMCGLYACKDVFYTWGLDERFGYVKRQYDRTYKREMAVAQHVFDMEWDGLDVDATEIRRTNTAVEEDVKYWLSVIRHQAGDPHFEPTAATLRELFYEKLGMDVPKRTKDNLPATDKESRELLEKQYPENAGLMRALSKHSSVEKVRSTYAIAFLKHVTPERKIHPSYNQIERKDEGGVPKTGRLSSQDPNIQNIRGKPIHLVSCRCEDCVKMWKDEWGIEFDCGEERTISVRRYFTIPKGTVRAFIDLSQIELRTLAWFSRDKRLLYCYANDLDVHQITADEVTGGDRKVAKEVNFGNNYGMTEIGLAKRLPYYASDPERALIDARAYLKKFFQTYAGILPFKYRFAQEMRRNDNMFVSPFGRPRRIPEIGSDESWIRERGERMMMSSIISGTAADLMKEIMIRCGKMIEDKGWSDKVHFRKTIHDEIAWDMPIKGCTEVLPELMHCFTDWPMFEDQGVPIRASCELSTTTWEDKREIEFLNGGRFRYAA